MNETQIGFIHIHYTNNGYADYTISEEIIGIFYKAGLGSTTYSDSSWNDIADVKEKLDTFYQVLHQSTSKHTSSISIITYTEQEWLEKFK